MNQNFLIRAVIAVSAETYSITSYLTKVVFLICFRFFGTEREISLFRKQYFVICHWDSWALFTGIVLPKQSRERKKGGQSHQHWSQR